MSTEKLMRKDNTRDAGHGDCTLFGALTRDRVNLVLTIELQQTRVYQDTKVDVVVSKKMPAERAIKLQIIAVAKVVRTFVRLDPRLLGEVGDLICIGSDM